MQSRRMRWAEFVARVIVMRNTYTVLEDTPEGKRPVGKPRRRWYNNVKIFVKEVWFDCVDWIYLAQYRD
jgi:hypothetical protein